MSTEEQQILNIKVRYEDAIQGIVRYKEELKDMAKAQEKLKDDFKEGKVTYDEYVTTLTAMDEQVKSHKGTIRELSKEVQNNIKTEKHQEGSLKSLRAELSNAKKAYSELSREEREGAKGEAMQKHINEITDEVKDAEQEIQVFSRGVGSYEDSIKNALGLNNDFANSFINMSRNGKGVNGFFDEAAASAKAFGNTLMGFMTNPVFIALAGIVGAGVAFKWFYDYNQGLAEATDKTQEFLGLTGSNLSNTVAEIQAAADGYGKSYDEMLSAVDSVMAQFGGDSEAALNIIKDGFQAGADEGGKFLDMLSQYGPSFHDAGIAASETVAIIAQTRSGIFSEGGLDLIQMASKRIREMSSATASALDGIGLSSKTVQQELEAGTKSTFDVVQEISARLRGLPSDSQKVGEVLKDVFGRQGANAGIKMIQQLDTMTKKIEDVKRVTGEDDAIQRELIETNAELNKQMSALFDMSQHGWKEMILRAKIFGTQTLMAVVKGLINVINYFIDLYNESMAVRAGVQAIILGLKNMWNSVKLVFNLIIDAAKSVGRAFKGIADIVEGIVTFSFSKIKSGFSQLANNYVKTFKEGFGNIKNFSTTVAKDSVDAINNVLKKKKIARVEIPVHVKESTSNNTVNTINTPTGTVTGTGNKKGGVSKKGNSVSQAELKKKEAEAIRRAEDLLTELVEQSEEQRRKAIEVQYNRQIDDLKRKLDTEQGLTVRAREAISTQIALLEQIKDKKLLKFDEQAKQEAIKREQAYIKNMLDGVEKGSKEEYRLKVQAINNEYQLELSEAKKMVMSEQEKNDLLASINAKYYAQEEQAYKEYHNRLQEEQVKAIENRYKSQILEAQINSGGTDELGILRLQMEEKQALLEQAQQREGETIEAFNQRKLQLAWDYEQAKRAISDKEVEVERGKYAAIAGMISGVQQIAEAFGEESKSLAKASKVLALAEIAINTGVALAAGIKQAQSVPFPGNLAAIATTVTTILSNIATAVKSVKSAKFAKGGLVTGAGSDTSDSIPAQLSNGESVLTARATRMFAPALSAFNQIGGGVPIINSNSNSQQIGEDYLARAVAKGMALMPRPIVSVEEINNISKRVEAIERLSRV